MNELQSSKNHLIRSRSSLYHVQPGEYYRGGDKIIDAGSVVMTISVLVMTFLRVLQLLWLYFVCFLQVKNKLRDLGKHGRFQIESVKDTSQEFKSTIQRSGRLEWTLSKMMIIGVDQISLLTMILTKIDHWSKINIDVDQSEQCIIRWERTVSKTSTFQLFP